MPLVCISDLEDSLRRRAGPLLRDAGACAQEMLSPGRASSSWADALIALSGAMLQRSAGEHRYGMLRLCHFEDRAAA